MNVVHEASLDVVLHPAIQGVAPVVIVILPCAGNISPTPISSIGSISAYRAPITSQVVLKTCKLPIFNSVLFIEKSGYKIIESPGDEYTFSVAVVQKQGEIVGGDKLGFPMVKPGIYYNYDYVEKWSWD